MKNLNQYVGRTVKGVKFNSNQYRDTTYVPGMDKHVGHEGIIAAYKKSDHSFRVEFETPVKDYWFYPVEVILPQLEGELIGYTINDEKYAKIISKTTITILIPMDQIKFLEVFS